MVETAMLKVFTTEALWEIINDAFQIHGGSAYFTNLPLERMLRDARINQIAEGANEVLTSFVALVGMRAPGEQLRGIWEALQHPGGDELRKAWRLGVDRAGAALRAPPVRVQSHLLQPQANQLGRLIRHFNLMVDRALVRHREEILERQYIHDRIGRAAMEIFASACVLSRWDGELQSRESAASSDGDNRHVAELFLKGSFRRIRALLAAINDNDDASVTATADWVLGQQTTT
jgi:alkylation response protein AidB-like acyl-CoA dehydrogenase